MARCEKCEFELVHGKWLGRQLYAGGKHTLSCVREGCPHKSREEKETEPTSAPVVTENWAHDLWRFLASEYGADPDTGQAVTAECRPHFEALSNFIADMDTSPNHSDSVAVPREVVERAYERTLGACLSYKRQPDNPKLREAESDAATLAAKLERGS